MSDSNLYKIKYRKGDVEFEIQRDKKWVEEKYAEFTKIFDSEAQNKVQQVTDPEDHLPMSIAEFLRSKKDVKTHTDEFVIFSYWLYHKENMTGFNLQDIRECYKTTRLPVPDNPSQYLGDLQKKGIIKKLSEKKDNMNSYIITPTGEAYVESL